MQGLLTLCLAISLRAVPLAASMGLAAGSRCPAFSLTAAVSGREVSPAALKGKRAVLVLHGATTTDAAKEVGKAVRAKHPGADVVVASLVNLRSMAGMWRKVAE
ncbi:MAG TPA: hypothetical protein VI796_07140, partial [Candidatus Thermoplasmatota archaeon]|nr:hypothetical protein [Candidatus Thermoplasmatota archaeon]